MKNIRNLSIPFTIPGSRSRSCSPCFRLPLPQPITRCDWKHIPGIDSQDSRSLEQQRLIEAANYEYRLTPLGGVVTLNVEGFVRSMGGIDQHHTFFTDHDLSDLPAAFLFRIGDLYNAEPKQDTTTDMFYVYSHYLEILKDAAYIHGILRASPGLLKTNPWDFSCYLFFGIGFSQPG